MALSFTLAGLAESESDPTYFQQKQATQKDRFGIGNMYDMWYNHPFDEDNSLVRTNPTVILILNVVPHRAPA